MKTVSRWLFVTLVLGALLVVGLSQAATTAQSSVLVATINRTWGNFKIEDIVMCSDGSAAWAASVGSGSLDDLRLFKITNVNTANPTVDTKSFIDFLDDDDFGTKLPAGIGPRGYPGMAVDITCSFAYVPAIFLDTALKVDLKAGLAKAPDPDIDPFGGHPAIASDGVIVWPANYSVDSGKGKISRPVDAVLNFPSDTRLIVSASGESKVYVLDTQTGKTIATASTSGIGPGSLAVVGSGYAVVVQHDSTLACIDLQSLRVTTISGLGNNPFMAVASGDGKRLYVSNQGSNSVSVLDGGGCKKSVVKAITVGNSPRHLALSNDGGLLYVSNATDNTVSAISTAKLAVVDTINVAQGEPAPVGMVAVSQNNRYLYVYWEGGVKGTPGRSQIKVYDVSGLR